jgi:hypothetical protein
MILGDVEELITTVEIDDETYEEIIKARTFSLVDVLCWPVVFQCFACWFAVHVWSCCTVVLQ